MQSNIKEKICPNTDKCVFKNRNGKHSKCKSRNRNFKWISLPNRRTLYYAFDKHADSLWEDCKKCKILYRDHLLWGDYSPTIEMIMAFKQVFDCYLKRDWENCVMQWEEEREKDFDAMIEEWEENGDTGEFKITCLSDIEAIINENKGDEQ